MHYTIIESATGDELGTIETSADTAVEDLVDAGWIGKEEEDDYDVDEDHPMAEDGDLVILGPDFPEFVLEPDAEYDEEGDEDEDDYD